MANFFKTRYLVLNRQLLDASGNSLYLNGVEIGSLISGNLTLTGAALLSVIAQTGQAAWTHGQNNALNLSGSIANTGSQAWNAANNNAINLSGRDTAISGALEGRIALTGQAAWTHGQNNALNLSGRLFQTGSILDNKINSLSGWVAPASPYYVYTTGQQDIVGRKNFLTGISISGDGLDFTHTGKPAYLEGRVFYDYDEHTLAYYNDADDITINVAQENVIRVKNTTLNTITNGMAVYVSGAQGMRPLIYPAIASNDEAVDRILGIATHDIPAGQNGYVTTLGLVHDLNLTGFLEGDEVFLSPTISGGYTSLAPDKPNLVVKLGVVLHNGQANGILYTNPETAESHLQYLHDIWINQSTLANNNLLIYNSFDGYWKNVPSFSGLLESGYRSSDISLSGNLYQTGSDLFNRDASISGGLEARIRATGQAAWISSNGANIDISGRINASGRRAWDDAINISGRLALSGSILDTYIRFVSGNLISTGQTAQNNALNLSGSINVSGRRAWDDAINLSGRLFTTGSILDGKINSLSGYNETFFVHRTGTETISGSKTFTSEIIGSGANWQLGNMRNFVVSFGEGSNGTTNLELFTNNIQNLLANYDYKGGSVVVDMESGIGISNPLNLIRYGNSDNSCVVAITGNTGQLFYTFNGLSDGTFSNGSNWYIYVKNRTQQTPSSVKFEILLNGSGAYSTIYDGPMSFNQGVFLYGPIQIPSPFQMTGCRYSLRYTTQNVSGYLREIGLVHANQPLGQNAFATWNTRNYFDSIQTILNTTDSTSLTNASIITSGGASITKNLSFGGHLISGTTNIADIYATKTEIINSGRRAWDDAINLSGRLSQTGSILDAYIRSVSGNLILTGQTAQSNATNLSGSINSSGRRAWDDAINLSGRLFATGSLIAGVSGGLQVQITSNDSDISTLKTNLNATGRRAWDDAINLSGRLFATGALIAGVSGGLQVQIANNDSDILTLSNRITSTGQNSRNDALNLSGSLSQTGATLFGLINTANVTAANAVYTTGTQFISGQKYFIGNTFIDNLYVTGTQFIVNTQDMYVADNWIILNSTGGARDSALFVSTGLTGLNATGAIFGFDVPSNTWRFGLGSQQTDLLFLPRVASGEDIDALDTRLIQTGYGLSVHVSSISGNINASGRRAWDDAINLSGRLTQTGVLIGQEIDALSGVLNTINGNVVWTTGNQSIGGVKTFTSLLNVTGTNILIQHDNATLRLATATNPNTYDVKLVSNHSSSQGLQLFGTASRELMRYNWSDSTLSLMPTGTQYVSIGAPTAAERFQVSGGNILLSNGNALRFYNKNGVNVSVLALTSADNFQFGTISGTTQAFFNSANGFYFYTGDGTSPVGSVMVVRGNGNVSIGSNFQNSLAKLHVSGGDIRVEGAYLSGATNIADIFATKFELLTSGRRAWDDAINLSGRLFATGALIANVSGGLQAQINSNDSDITSLSNRITSTGQGSRNDALNLSGNLNATGRRAWDDAVNLSGRLTITGQTLINISNSISGWVDNFYVHRFGKEAITGTKSFMVGNIGIGTLNPIYNLEVTGSFAAASKSFVIPHPLISGKRLQHGVVEGPEHSIFIRGRLINSGTIQLPDYWSMMVDKNSITVQLTPIGGYQKLYVDEVSSQKIIIKNGNFLDKKINCFYYVQGERTDIEKLKVTL